MDDAGFRSAAFDWLRAEVDRFGDVLRWDRLTAGFPIHGKKICLLGQPGIFKPEAMRLPLSIRTSPNGPYADTFRDDRGLCYSYRGTDPMHRDNVGLRTAMQERVPLVYFHGITPGRYLAAWPAYVVHDDPKRLTFLVQFDHALPAAEPNITQPSVGRDSYAYTDSGASLAGDSDRTLVREYATSAVRSRIHQHAFRERVLRAYRTHCAFCRLRHAELLDAAHIIPDSEPGGEPRVQNGLALCKLHHAAFDRAFVGVTPDYVIQVRPDILEEDDGPMLLHGLKGLHQSRILLPRQAAFRPDRERLDERYRRFLGAV